ncbi:hypothetical protein X727_09560 [Mesorhizobium sp. L103C119B0]|nr:hypothetical protein X727_09560 [Mesorhizobium sp. L103C119B0]
MRLKLLISPLVGEMAGRPEGGPPSVLPDISPTRGEIALLALACAKHPRPDLRSDLPTRGR